MKLAALLLMLVNALLLGNEPCAAQPPEAGTGPPQEFANIPGTGLQASTVHGSGCDEPSQCATMRVGFEYDELSRVKTATRAQYASPGDVLSPELITTRRKYNGRGQMVEERTEHGLGNVDVVEMSYDGVGRLSSLGLRDAAFTRALQSLGMSYEGVRLTQMDGRLQHVSGALTGSITHPYSTALEYTGLATTGRTTRYAKHNVLSDPSPLELSRNTKLDSFGRPKELTLVALHAKRQRPLHRKWQQERSCTSRKARFAIPGYAGSQPGGDYRRTLTHALAPA